MAGGHRYLWGDHTLGQDGVAGVSSSLHASQKGSQWAQNERKFLEGPRRYRCQFPIAENSAVLCMLGLLPAPYEVCMYDYCSPETKSLHMGNVPKAPQLGAELRSRSVSPSYPPGHPLSPGTHSTEYSAIAGQSVKVITKRSSPAMFFASLKHFIQMH